MYKMSGVSAHEPAWPVLRALGHSNTRTIQHVDGSRTSKYCVRELNGHPLRNTAV